MGTLDPREAVNGDRRRMIGAAALAVAATRLGLVSPGEAPGGIE